jgi:hypothetical protein
MAADLVWVLVVGIWGETFSSKTRLTLFRPFWFLLSVSCWHLIGVPFARQWRTALKPGLLSGHLSRL